MVQAAQNRDPSPLQNLVRVTKRDSVLVRRAMLALPIQILLSLRSAFNARASREAEYSPLAPTNVVLNRKRLARPRLRNIDRLVLMWLYRLFSSVLDAIIIVKPETVLRWHRRGFRVLALEVLAAQRPAQD
jgi:hypothetical protein